MAILAYQSGAVGHDHLADNWFAVEAAMKPTDPLQLLLADPLVGLQLNADRSNYRCSNIPGETRVYGKCDFEVDCSTKVAESPPTRRGDIARAYLCTTPIVVDCPIPLPRSSRSSSGARQILLMFGRGNGIAGFHGSRLGGIRWWSRRKRPEIV